MATISYKKSFLNERWPFVFSIAFESIWSCLYSGKNLILWFYTVIFYIKLIFLNFWAQKIWIRFSVKNDPCENLKPLCTFFCNALERKQNKIVRLPIIFLCFNFLPTCKLQSWYMYMFKRRSMIDPCKVENLCWKVLLIFFLL